MSNTHQIERWWSWWSNILLSTDQANKKYTLANITTTKKIALIFTWWTFLCTQNESREVTHDASINNIHQTTWYFPKNLKYAIYHPYNIDSSDLIPENRYLLTHLIKELEQHTWENKIDGYVIVHGTDTLEYTASILSFMIQWLKKPIIITGSMQSIAHPDGDGPWNIQKAIIAAQSDLIWCYVAFGKYLLQGNKVKKTHTSDVNTFSTLTHPPVWYFTKHHGNHIDTYNCYIHEPLSQKINDIITSQADNIFTTLQTNIAYLTLTPWVNLDILDYYRTQWVKAIVLIWYGDWNVPACYQETTSMSTWRILQEKIKKCIDSWMVIVLWSQCYIWNIEHTYTGWQQMLSLWVLSAQHHTLPAIWAKLAFLLAHSTDVPNDFSANISGELL